jgi:hypothetical protein
VWFAVSLPVFPVPDSPVLGVVGVELAGEGVDVPGWGVTVAGFAVFF